MDTKYSNISDEEIYDAETDDVMERMRSVINSMWEDVLFDSPLWMRLNFIANQIANQIDKIKSIEGKEITDSDIDWEKINDILTRNVSKYDYNNFNKINSIEELYRVRANCVAASLNLGSWFLGICKTCGKTFCMDIDEVDFYKDKEFELPKRCHSCRDNNKLINNKKVGITNNKTAPERTAMEEAMIKAGLIEE